jgi:hypothetical protein
MQFQRRRGARPSIVAILAGALVLASAAPAPAAEVGAVSDLTWGLGTTVSDRTVPVMRDAGVRWVRLNVSWAAVEPNGKGVLDAGYLSQVDHAVDAARAAGIRVLMPIADGVPYWASGDPAKTSVNGTRSWNRTWRPARFEDYGDAVEAIVRRYSARGVHHFEVWNEPNHGRFWPSGPDAGEYVEMLRAGSGAIRAADADASVVLGGISRNDYAWLEQLYAAGARDLFDIASVHPYSGAVDPTWCWNQAGTTRKAKDAFCGLEEMHASMRAAGDGDKPIWVTEFGWSTTTGSYGVTESQQAEFLTKAYRKLEAYPWVPVALWYSFRNNPGLADDPAQWEANAGLLRTDYTAKPALAAMRSYAQANTSSQPSPAPTPTATATATPTPTSTAAPAPAPAPSAPSDAPPAVSLLAPTAGAGFDSTLAYRATAADDRGVARVEFLFDGKVVATDSSPSYAATWKVPKRVALGTHVAGARVVDTAGQTTVATVSVTRVRTARRHASTSSERRTSTSLRVTSRRRGSLMVSGRVRGAAGGRLRLSVRPRESSPRRAVTRSVRLRRGGRYRSRLRLQARTGRYRVEARFAGGRGATPSARTTTIRLG